MIIKYLYVFQLLKLDGLPGQSTRLVTSIATKAESDTVTIQGTLSPVVDRPMFMASKGKMFPAKLVTVQVLVQVYNSPHYLGYLFYTSFFVYYISTVEIMQKGDLKTSTKYTCIILTRGNFKLL